MRESGWNSRNVAQWRREGEGAAGVEPLPLWRVVLVGRCGWRVLRLLLLLLLLLLYVRRLYRYRFVHGCGL